MPDSATSTRSSAGQGVPWDVADLRRLLAAPARSATGWVGAPPPEKPLIPFTAGVPDAETFPVAEVGEAVRTVLEREPAPALEYLLGTPQGVPELRKLVVERMEPESEVSLSEANVTITSGAAQALENVFRTFLDPGDTVVIEGPSYGGAIRAIQGAGGVPVTVEMDKGGIRLDLLEATLSRLAGEGRTPKIIYVMPTFHNPAGLTMPLERRRQLVELAARHRVLILEDDAYSTIRFSGEPLPSILSVAAGIGVLRCGTVSKTIAPGLRVGWVKGSADLINGLVRMRFDNGTSPFNQRLVRAYVEAGAYEPHVEVMRNVYRRKYEAMDAALGEHCSRYVSWNEPEGGFYFWLKLPDGLDCHTLQEFAWDEGVGYFLGTSFYAGNGGSDHIRLAYSAVKLDLIAEGCARLGRALRRALATRA
jgi:2-aminoadipate transaminase